MEVLNIVPYLPKASGVTTFVVELTDALQKDGTPQYISVYDQKRFDVAPSNSDVPRISLQKAFEIMSVGRCDVVHIHGVWPYFMHNVVAVARRKNLPIVWSLHGMLSPWAMHHKKWKKWPAWHLWQRRDLKKAAALHVTSDVEASQARGLGFSQPIINAPLGTFLREPSPACDRDKTVLFVGRLNPVKAIDQLIMAWAIICQRCPEIKASGWQLRLIGTDASGYQDFLEKLVKEVDVSNSVQFVGPKYGTDLEDEYRHASLIVLPSHTENFGGVVIDALSWGIPVVASTNTPWSILEEHGCGRWVPNKPEVLAKTIADLLLQDSARLMAMGMRGRNIVEENYTWAAVAKKMLGGYQSLIDQL